MMKILEILSVYFFPKSPGTPEPKGNGDLGDLAFLNQLGKGQGRVVVDSAGFNVFRWFVGIA